MKSISAGVGGFCWRPDKNRNEYYIFLFPLFMRGKTTLVMIVAPN